MTIADDARALVTRTTAAQGIPEHVTDRATLARVAAVMLAARRDEVPATNRDLDVTITTSPDTTTDQASRGSYR